MRPSTNVKALLLVLSVVSGLARGKDAKPSPAKAGQTRCGWFINPTPGNASLKDADGEWIIGIQGGYQAEGDWPSTEKSWIETNGHYGYGCVCIDATVDAAAHRIKTIISGRSLPLARCKADKKLGSP